MSLQLYLSDDSAVAPTHAFAAAAGSSSTTWALHFWADKGVPGGTYSGVRLALEAEISAGVWAETGTALVDRQEIQCRVVGSANPGADALFTARGTSGWQPMGAGAWLDVGNLRGNCAVYLEFRYSPSIQNGSGTVATAWRVRIISGEWARGTGPGVAAYGTGLHKGTANTAITEWVDAPLVTETGTPDDVVNIEASSWIYAGVEDTQAGGTVTLNQDDSAAAALAAGESYIALVVQPQTGTALAARKGVKATVPTAPAPTAGDLVIAQVTVAYQAGGTSVVTQGNVTQIATDGRALLSYSALLLTVEVGRVRALSPSTWIDVPVTQALTLTASVTSTIYLATDGTVSTTATTGALPLWECVADGTGITSATDLRAYVD